MRELTQNENQSISGGFVCIDGSTLDNIRGRAAKDGIVASLALTSISGIITWAATASVLTTLSAGALVAPYALILGYANSGAWSYINN